MVKRLTKRQLALAEKRRNKQKASNSHPMKRHTTDTRRLEQMNPQILPYASSHAISHPSDPFARTGDVIPPPSIQGVLSPRTSQPTNPDAGHTLDTAPKKNSAIHRKFVGQQMAPAEKDRNKGNDSKGHPMKKCTRQAMKMTSQFAPCASSHAISRPTDPFARTADVRDPPSVQGAPSPHASQPANSDSGRNPRSFAALELQNNDGKPIIYLRGQGFLPSRPAANEIENILKSHYTDPWPSWKKIPISARDMWFREFLGKFSICPLDYDWAKKNFEIQAATMLKDILNEAQTTMNKPNWIKDDVWERLCEHWKSEELKKNRANMTQETGTLPTPLELFRSKHLHKDNSWVDIQDEFTHTLEQLTKSAFAQGKPPPSELDVWYDVARSRKGKMSELGMAGKPCYHASSSSMEWVKRQEFDELEKKMKEIKNERDKLKTRVANIERLAEHNNTLIRELMESMNMPSIMGECQDDDDIESLGEPYSD